ncbi:MAG: DUF4214 domain-containing protein [Deltaproteobacteria bacterium]|nr:DUF4214 domain-containing protein [Deltaproteobacteria bacterium]
MKKQFVTSGVVLFVCVIAALSSVMAQRERSAPLVFSYLLTPRADISPGRDELVRVRNTGILDTSLIQKFKKGDHALVDFGTGLIEVVTDQVEVASGRVKWISRPLNGGIGDVIVFSVVNGYAACIAKINNMSFRCDPEDANGTVFIIDTTDAFELPSMAVPAPEPPLPDSRYDRPVGQSWADLSLTASGASGSSGLVVDVLAMYTPGLRQAYGGSSEVMAVIQNLFDYANYIFTNSNTGVTLRVIGWKEIATGDDEDVNTTLNKMAYGSGEFSDLLQVMDNTGADIAVLFRKYSPYDEWCGLAYINNREYCFTDPSYSHVLFRAVVEVGEYTVGGGTIFYCGDDTLAHELGHNFGCDHDLSHGGGNGLYSFSNGYCGPDYGTVMSYCEPSVPYFSDDMIVDGKRIGDSNARNAETIRRVAVYVAAIRGSDGSGGATGDEYTRRMQEVYVAYYGRPADPAGLDWWSNQLRQAGGNLDAIIQAFGNSEEFERRYGGLSNSELIDTIYLQMFNRWPDEAGKNFYLRQLNLGTMTLQSITLNVLDGAVGTDAVIIDHKVEVAEYFTDKIRNGCSYTSEEIGVSFIQNVDETVDSVVLAKELIDAYCGN